MRYLDLLEMTIRSFRDDYYYIYIYNIISLGRTSMRSKGKQELFCIPLLILNNIINKVAEIETNLNLKWKLHGKFITTS